MLGCSHVMHGPGLHVKWVELNKWKQKLRGLVVVFPFPLLIRSIEFSTLPTNYGGALFIFNFFSISLHFLSPPHTFPPLVKPTPKGIHISIPFFKFYIEKKSSRANLLFTLQSFLSLSLLIFPLKKKPTPIYLRIILCDAVLL